MAYLKVRKWRECVLRLEHRKYEKTEAWASLGSHFVGHASRVWWDGVCNICKFQSARTGIKEALWGGAWLLLGSRIMQTSVLTRQLIVRVRERNRERQDRWRTVKRLQPEVMKMKAYSTLLKASGLEPQHQMPCRVIFQDIRWECVSYSSAEAMLADRAKIPNLNATFLSDSIRNCCKFRRTSLNVNFLLKIVC